MMARREARGNMLGQVRLDQNRLGYFRLPIMMARREAERQTGVEEEEESVSSRYFFFTDHDGEARGARGRQALRRRRRRRRRRRAFHQES